MFELKNTPIYGDMFLSALYEWEYTPPHVDFDFETLFKWIHFLPYLCDPVSMYYLGVSLGDFTPGEYSTGGDLVPSTVTGFYDTLGYHDCTYKPMDEPGAFYPPARKSPTYVPGWHWPESYGGAYWRADESEWNSWVDQMLVCCFLYRFGILISAGMGVQYAASYEDGVDIAPVFAPGSPGYDDKIVPQYLCQLSMADIVAYIQEKYIEYAGCDSESAALYLRGFEQLNRGYTAMIEVGNSTSVTSGGHRRLYDGTADFVGSIWSNGFFRAVRHIMCPEIMTTPPTRFEGATGADAFWYEQPRIHFTNITHDPSRPGAWKMANMRPPPVDTDSHWEAGYGTVDAHESGMALAEGPDGVLIAPFDRACTPLNGGFFTLATMTTDIDSAFERDWNYNRPNGRMIKKTYGNWRYPRNYDILKRDITVVDGPATTIPGPGAGPTVTADIT